MLAYASGQPLNVMGDNLARKTAEGWRAYNDSAFAHFAQLKEMLDEKDPSYRDRVSAILGLEPDSHTSIASSSPSPRTSERHASAISGLTSRPAPGLMLGPGSSSPK